MDFKLNSGKTVFLKFSRKEAVFGKIKYSPFSFPLGRGVATYTHVRTCVPEKQSKTTEK